MGRFGLFIAGAVVLASEAFGYHAPVEPFNWTGSITGTLGEPRPVGSDPRRLHAGVDIGVAGTTYVYSILTGTIPVGAVKDHGRPTQERVRIGKFEYIHVRVNQDVYDEQLTKPYSVTGLDGVDPIHFAKVHVTTRDDAGDITHRAHLHLNEYADAESSTRFNPLRPNGLDNYDAAARRRGATALPIAPGVHALW